MIISLDTSIIFCQCKMYKRHYVLVSSAASNFEDNVFTEILYFLSVRMFLDISSN
jgi:hypothetical protein